MEAIGLLVKLEARPGKEADWRDREEVDGAGQRIICGSSAGGKSGGPCKHTLKR